MYWREALTVVILLLAISAVQAAQFEGASLEPVRFSPTGGGGTNQYAQQNDTVAVTPENITLNATLNVEISSDVYSEKDKRVLYCVRGNYVVVRNRIFLTGSDLDKVKKVTYLLHPTFPDPVAVSEDRENDFEIWIWCWGGFLIRANITTTTGQSFGREYRFTFREKFEEARSKGIPMMMSCIN